MVLWCLYADQVEALARRFERRSIEISKQSITTATLSPKHTWNDIGMALLKHSRSGHGQWMSGLSLVSIAFNHFNIMQGKLWGQKY